MRERGRKEREIRKREMEIDRKKERGAEWTRKKK